MLNKAADKEYMELVDELEYTISFVNHGNDTYEDILNFYYTDITIE